MAQLDISATSRVPFTRLVGVELRKARGTEEWSHLIVSLLLWLPLPLGLGISRILRAEVK